jgi:limonene-1,2-epoxide hydrolase
LIHRRCFTALLLVLITSGSFLFLLENPTEVSAQGPPYFPLQPSWFKVVNVIWGSSDNQIKAAPGDTNIPLIVTLQNIGNSTITGITETLILQQPFTNASGGQLASSFYQNGSMSPGSTGASEFILNIDRNAVPGEYVLTMRIDYLMIVSGVGQTLYIAQEAEVSVPVLVSNTSYVVIYSVNVYPLTVSPGGNLTISGSVVDTTTATSFYNTNVSISSPAFVQGTYVFIGQIDSNIPRPFSAAFQVKRGNFNGTFPIRIVVTYLDTLNVLHVSSTVLTLQVIQQTTSTIPSGQFQARGPVQLLIDFLVRIFEFFFGSPSATI